MTLDKRAVPRVLAAMAVGIAVITVSVYAIQRWNRQDEVWQPIAFNHRIHTTEVGLSCGDCHEYFSTGPRSGLPSVETCTACHSEALTESPEEARLLELYRNGKPVVFRKLFHLPPDIYYSHRRHAVLGEIPCAECHGDIENSLSPPSRPLVTISMEFCTDCHVRSRVTEDCKACHR